jgi:hypothetical protein
MTCLFPCSARGGAGASSMGATWWAWMGRRPSHHRCRWVPLGSRSHHRLMTVADGWDFLVACCAQPYVTVATEEDSIEKGLYRFLTPMVLEPEASGLDTTSGVEILPEVDENGVRGCVWRNVILLRRSYALCYIV